MNKSTIITLVGIVVLIAGAIAYLLLTQDNDKSKNNEANSSKVDSTPANETPNLSTSPRAGSYVDYSADAVTKTSGTKLIFFYAPWCPQCRSMDESIKTGGVPDGVTVFKTDYDSNQELRAKYGVTIQTTFVKIDDNGNKVASYVAYEEPVFSKVEQELLR